MATVALGTVATAPVEQANGGYATAGFGLADSIPAPGRDSLAASGDAAARMQGYVPGHISVAGLPPVAGSLQLMADGLVFHPAGGMDSRVYPVYRQRRLEDGGIGRRTAVRLFAVASGSAEPVYLFHLDGAVFETALPGTLLDLAADPAWIDSLGDTRMGEERPLVAPGDTAAQLAAIDRLLTSAYADTLFQLFGRPERPVGLVGSKGASARRLGEYIASRDSLSLAPGRMTSREQLRHGFAHELAHRWQRNAPATVARLWRNVPPIRDSLRYGFGNRNEQQAEAIAFAVHFVQATASPALSPERGLELVSAYERLVPGTRAIARWLLTQPIYADHPLMGSSLDAPVGHGATEGARSEGFQGTE
jgi:hypothetical protein